MASGTPRSVDDTNDEPVVPLLLDDAQGYAPPEPVWTLSLRADALNPPPPNPTSPPPASAMVADPDAPRGGPPPGDWPDLPAAGPDAEHPARFDEATTPQHRAIDGEVPGAGSGAAAGPTSPPAGRLMAGSGSVPVPPLPSQEERAHAKARRRANVRAAQLARRGAARPAVPDVLLLEADAESRATVHAVLEGFGFRVHPAVSVPEAQALSLRRPYAVVFLGLGRDAVEAAALCQRLHETRRGRPQALVAIGDAHSHADRVRLQLAGADAMLVRPVQRGELARVLEAADVALPHDPRLH